MKIRLYLNHYPASGQNINDGAVKFVHGLASGLVACGADVGILCAGRKDSLVRSPNGFEIRCFSSAGKNGLLKISPSLKTYVQNQEKDTLFILNGMFSIDAYLLSRTLLKAKIPYVISPLDPYHSSVFQAKNYLKWPYWYLFERPMLERAIAIQLLDNRHAQYLMRLNVKNKTIATPCGFFKSEVIPVPPARSALESKIKLLFLGRIDAHNKGLDILVDAVRELPEKPVFELCIQGPDKGDKAKIQKRVADMGLSQVVTFLEPDYTRSSQSIIASHDMLCIPSRFEGFSQSAMEAMLATRVVLISEVAGIAPYVTASDCGVVVSPEVSAIRDGILMLSKRRLEWGEMGLRGRQYVLENFEWIKIAAHAMDEYRLLLSGSKVIAG